MKTIKTTRTNQQLNKRAGFTLLELLAVIAIISILLSLILPAIVNAFGSATETAVTVELKSLETALAKFESRFARYPPSSVTLYATQAEWNADVVSKEAIRQMWPDFDFSNGGRVAAGGTPQNSDTSLATYHPWGTAAITLSGPECLVFFLGGVAVPNGADVPPTLTGFSSSERYPFAISGSNRTGPFYTEWKDLGTRLIDPGIDDGGTPDGVYEYTDGLSASNSTGISYAAAEDGRYFNGARAYFQGDGKTAWSQDTFQLIAPGADGEFGNIQIDRSVPNIPIWTEETDLSGRLQERDNITNFSGGRLQN